ncbi:MAG: cyclic nucleotide-binding domain-containing protein [Anaerolineae bacterium]
MASAGQSPQSNASTPANRISPLAKRFAEEVRALLAVLRAGNSGGLIAAGCDDLRIRRWLFSYFRQRLQEEKICVHPFELRATDPDLAQRLAELVAEPGFKDLELSGRYKKCVIFVYGVEEFADDERTLFIDSLNASAGYLANLARPVVLWGRHRLLAQLARDAPTLWAGDRRLFKFPSDYNAKTSGDDSAPAGLSALARYLGQMLEAPDISRWDQVYLPLKAIRAAETVDLVPPRHTLTHEELQDLIEHFPQIVTFEPNQIVFERGEIGNQCYVIVEGQVEVLVPDALGQEKVITTLRQGDFFGEIALLKRVPRTATIRTLESSAFVVLSPSRLRDIASKTPAVLDVLTEIGQQRLEDRLHDPQELLSPLRRFAMEGVNMVQEVPQDVRQLIKNDRRVVILGEAGGGKTTVLHRLALETAQTSVAALQAGEDSAVMPILLKLNALSPDLEVEDLILEVLQAYGLPQFTSTADVRRLLKGELGAEFPVSHFLFLMDGLNEIPAYQETQAALERFIREYARNRFVLSCRVQDYTAVQRFRTVLLQRLSKDEIETFLVNYLGEDAARRIAREIHTDNQLEDLAQTPLALYMFAQIAKSSAESLPKNRGILFERFAESFLERADGEWRDVQQRPSGQAQIPAVIIKGSLSSLGLTMQQEEVWTLPRQRWFDLIAHQLYLYREGATAKERAIARALTPEDVQEKIAYSGLLRYSGEKGWVEFTHHTLQEFFAALALREQNLDIETRIRSGEARRRWQGTVILLYGIAQNKAELFSKIVGPSFDYERIWLAAQCLANAGEEVAVAVSELERALPLTQHFAMLFSVGLACRQVGRYPEALTYLLRGAEERPGSPDVQYELGALYRRLNQHERAIKHLSEAIHLRPDFVDAYNQLGIAYYDQRKYEEAVTIFRATTQLEPGNAHHYYNLGTIQKVLRDYEAAKLSFEQALQLKPDYLEARKQLEILDKALLSGVVRVLEKIPMLHKLSLEQCVLLANRLKDEVYQAGQIVFHMGEIGDTFYIIESGEVEVLAPDLRGQQAVINLLGPGEFFGEIALLRAVPRTATIRVVSPTRLLGLSREDFHKVVDRYPIIAHNLAETSDYRLLRDRQIGRRVELDDYYDPDYIEELTRQDEVTVIMGDIHGSTYLTNAIGPTLMVAFLDEYLQRMSKIIVESGGAIDKSLGDSVMGVFGSYPGETESSSATRALIAALRMRDTYFELRNEWKSKSREFAKTGMGIGISTGAVAIGTVGHEAAMVGPVVNTSSKLSKMAIKGRDESELYVDARTRQLLAGQITVEALDPEYVSRKSGGAFREAHRVVRHS